MADYRYFKTIFWNDPYIKDECKTVSEKELFIWLFTNGHSTQAGIYPISTKTISEETGIIIGRVKEIFEKFIKDKKIKYQDKVLWVINFLKHQPNKSSKVLTRIAEDLGQLDNHPLVKEFLEKYEHLVIPYQYPIHTLSDKEKGKEKNTKGKEEEKENILQQSKALLTSFPNNAQSLISDYIELARLENKTKTITAGRELRLITEIFDLCKVSDSERFYKALKITCDKSAPHINYIKAVLKRLNKDQAKEDEKRKRHQERLEKERKVAEEEQKEREEGAVPPPPEAVRAFKKLGIKISERKIK